jgi:hypothetical protein
MMMGVVLISVGGIIGLVSGINAFMLGLELACRNSRKADEDKAVIRRKKAYVIKSELLMVGSIVMCLLGAYSCDQ